MFFYEFYQIFFSPPSVLITDFNPVILARGFVSRELWVYHASQQSKYMRSLNLSDKNTHFATLSILQFLFPALLTKSNIFSFAFQKTMLNEGQEHNN